MLNKPMPTPNPALLTVPYNGDCPLCRSEIALTPQR
jgi:predicted DCC family thiol-disulfide oxidoreductase YuxK